MNPIVRNILAVLAGAFIGAVVNSGLVNIGPSIIPPPEGADLTTMEGIKASMELFEFKNFIFPFLAHAIGTLVGAFVAAKIAVSHKMKFALGIGAFFLLGGIAAMMMIGGPLWFNILDLLVAYIPMGYLGGKLATRD